MERGQLSTAIKKETERQRKAEANKSSYATSAFDNYASGNFQNTIYGTAEERARQAANLNQVGLMTGHNMAGIGNMQQDYYNSLQQRRSGEDATARRMLEQRNRNVANVGRNFSGRGVAGGVASAAMNEAQSKADLDVAEQMQTFARQNDRDLWDYVKRNQKVTGEALAMGMDQGLADQISTDSGSGITVICTELHRQGLLPSETYEHDAQFGRMMMKYEPVTFLGYQVWGSKVAKLMKKSKIITKFVSLIAIPWARYISGENNFIGRMTYKIGIPLCYTIGRFMVTLEKRKEA